MLNTTFNYKLKIKYFNFKSDKLSKADFDIANLKIVKFLYFFFA
jgi:hypothetical protein